MEIIIESPHFTVNDLLTEYITKKVNKLPHYDERLLKAEVWLRLDKSDTDENKICEIKLVAPRKNLFAKCNSTTFEDSITEVIHSLEKQMRKQKTKYSVGSSKINIEDIETEEAEKE